MKIKSKILVFLSHYLLGYKAWGPLPTIGNMVNHLSDDFKFLIITGDRDLGDSVSYTGIEFEKWVLVGKAFVYYAPNNQTSVNYYKQLIQNTEHVLTYLSNFFNIDFTIKQY